MKARELRIGNLVNYHTSDGDILVARIYWPDLKWISKDEKGFNIAHSAIPLTEEWLLKFGFYNNGTEEDNEFYSKKILGENKSNYQFFFRINDGISDCLISETIIFESEHVIVPKFIKYVHQLQNLYFALTGEELTIKTE